MNAEDAVLIIFFVAATIIWAIMTATDAEGAGTPIWQPVEYNIDENPLGAGASDNAARGPNNIVYRAWQDDDWSIKVSYTENNGSSWSTSTVINSAWEGHTSVGLGGIVILANNTTCVHFITEDADDAYNSYLAFRWNWSGAWDLREVYGSESTGMAYPKMALNETHILLMYCVGGNTLRFKTYELATDTFSTGPVTLPTVWIGTWTNAFDYDITVNLSGKFIIASETWSGVSYRYYVRDLDLDHVVVYADTEATIWEVYRVNLMCRSDDTLVIGCTFYYSAGPSYGLHVLHQSIPWGAFSLVNVNAANDYVLDVGSLGSCIDDDDRITLYWANDTGGGGGTYVSMVTGEGDYTEEEWEEAVVDAVYDYGTDDDAWNALGWYDGRYPIVGGYSVNIPNGGWMGQHIWTDEQGSPDDYAFALYWNASFHWYDWSEDPGPGPNGNGYDDTTTTESPIDMSQVGELWVLLAITAVLVGLARTYKMHIYRKRW